MEYLALQSPPWHLLGMMIMTPEMKSALRHLLIEHEGYSQKLYTDTTGHFTIGIGRNISDRGVLPAEIDMMCDHDMEYFYGKLNEHFEWFALLNEARQIALIDMCFMGFQNFIKFEKMIAAFARHDYIAASHEILDSFYAKQVGKRADDLAKIINTGLLLHE